MPEWSNFSDYEINEIKNKLNKQFDKAMKVVVILTPLICLVSPYLSLRRRRKKLIDRMDYVDAVLLFAIIWIIVLTGIWVWNNFMTNKQFSQNRKFLRKKSLTTTIKRKMKSTLKSYDNILLTNLDGELNSIEVSKEQSNKFEVGEEIEIEYEEQTFTILKLKKI